MPQKVTVTHHSMSLLAFPKMFIHSEGPLWFNSQIRHNLHKLHSLRRRFKILNLPSMSDKLALAEESF